MTRLLVFLVFMIMIVVAITDSRGNPSADLVGDLLVIIFTFLLFLLVAFLFGLLGTLLIMDLVTFLAGNINTLLLLHLLAHIMGHFPGHLLVHVLALVMGLDLAGAGDGDPDHVVTLALPFVLTVLAVCIGALLLSDIHVLSFVLYITHLLPHSCAFLLINLLTLFSVYWLAHSLIHRLAVGHPLSDAGVALYLLVLRLIHGFVLCPTLPVLSIFPRSSGSEANTS